MIGALRRLLDDLGAELALPNATLTNPFLERSPWLHALIDGIDATLIDLAAEEIGDAELARLAVQIADQTYAWHQVDTPKQHLLKSVFELRAQRVAGIRAAGRIAWIRETGTRVRILDAVEGGLLSLRPSWDDLADPIDPALVGLVLDWAWRQEDLQQSVRNAYRLPDDVDIDTVRQSFGNLVTAWLLGARFKEISARSNLDMDDLLGVYSSVVTFVLQTLVEQGIALLAKLLESQERALSPAVLQFPEHLRFGVPTTPARVLAAGGVRHRSAAVELGAALARSGVSGDDRMEVFAYARGSIIAHRDAWTARLGNLVTQRTLSDLSSVIGDGDGEGDGR